MGKSRKTLYIVGSLVIGVCSVLLILFAIILFGGVGSGSADLVFVSESREFVYDGVMHTADGWRLAEGELKKGHTALVSVSGSQREVGTSENSFTVKITDGRGNDITETYNIELRAGELKVTPRPLVITTASAEKLYDGYPLTNDGWDITSGSLLYGNYISVSVTGTRTQIGVSENVAQAKVYSYGGGDVSQNYAIEIEEGELSVKPVPVEISTKDAVKVYDGEPLFCREYSLNSTLWEGDYIESVTMPATITERGAVENYISEVIIKRADGSVADYYEINCRAGTLAVNPRVITVRSGDAVKDYDGKPLTCGDWEVVSLSKPLEGHDISVAVSGTRTEPGESPNYIAQTIIRDASGKDVSYNYEVTYHTGTLVVRGEVAGGNGSGNPVGSGGPSLDGSGEVAGGAGGETQSVALRINADSDGEVYLRLKSFGDFTGTVWQSATRYEVLTDDGYSANYLSGAALAGSGFGRTHIRIESLSNDYLLPAYPDTSEGDYEIQQSDVLNLGDTSKVYGLNCYLYDYLKHGKISADPHIYADYEKNYANFARANYLEVPSEEYAYFRNIILENGWNIYDRDVIAKVANYIKNAAKYNLNYDKKLDGEQHIAIAFLDEYKAGICQHYATAATLLFRTLGLPARYTIGYAATAKAGQWVEVTSGQAHAWVEVYIDGFGWTAVEVTGAAQESGGKGDLTVKPVDISKKFDGTVLTHSGEVQGISELLEQGFTYRAEVSGRQATIGASESRITGFTLFDRNGKDVTDDYNITFSTGKLQLYLTELTVWTASAVKTYDGTPLVTRGGVSYSGTLLSGHTVARLEATGSLTSVGRGVNTFDIVIVDEKGVNVTDYYKINAEYGALAISPRGITIVAESASKTYDGKPLTCNRYTVWADDGDKITHKLEVVISGTQTAVGYSENVVTSVKIYDADGNEVTANYAVTLYNGSLTVYP